MRVIKILLLIASIAPGIYVKGQWMTLFKVEFEAFPASFADGSFSLIHKILYVILLGAHGMTVWIAVAKVSRKILIWIPAIYLVCFITLDFFWIVFLIPFAVLWIFLITFKSATSRET